MTTRFSCSVDLSALTPASLTSDLLAATERAPSPAARLLAPGLAFTYRVPDCDVHVQDGVAVLICGLPRLEGTPAAQMDAARWLRLYAARGSDAIDEVRGRYCAVCVDARQGCVVLATDRFAVWPLCYAVQGSRLYIADRADRVPTPWTPSLDPQALFEYFYFHVIPAPRTVYHGVHRLAAGSAVVLRNDSQRTVHRWRPRFQEHDIRSSTDLGAEFRSLLRSAVAAETARGDIGCFLSGGTDSSTVAGLVSELSGAPARTYSIGFEAQGYDEMAYARLAARHFGTEHHEYYVTPHDIATALPTLASSFDQPFGNSSALPAYYCSKLARADGVHTMLAGDGGDELFGGNVRYARQHVFELYHSVPSVIRGGILEPMVEHPAALRLPIARKAARYVQQARVPMPDRLETYNLVLMLGADQIFTRDLLAHVDQQAPLRAQREVYQACTASALINRMLSYDWKYTLADNDLVKVRGAAQLAGIDVGFPLLDDELVDFSLRLAPDMKLKGSKLRYFFKEALKDFLPREIIAKKKHGFGLPFGPWLAQSPELQALARDALGSLEGRNLVRPQLIGELLSTRLQTHAGYFGEMVWLLVTLEHWLRTHRTDFRVEAPMRAAQAG